MIKHFKTYALALSAIALTLTSCQNDTNLEETPTPDASLINSDILGGRELVKDEKLLSTIRSLDIDIGVVTKGDFHFPDGSVEERIYIGSDIVFTNEELKTLSDAQAASGSRQYRTFNLVTGDNRTINILGYVANDQFSLSNKARAALQDAVNAYNGLNNMALQFNLTFGSNHQAADMVVYDNTANNPNSAGGVAGFPSSNGTPHKYAQIYGLEGFSRDLNAHVIAHEMGHSIGFRHSDWFDRLSCPANLQGNEGGGSDGAVHIPGTPTGRDQTSMMQACGAGNPNGIFNGNDIIALRAMYPESSGSICDGVSEFQSGVNYPVGARVTYFGNLYQRTSSGWTWLGAC